MWDKIKNNKLLVSSICFLVISAGILTYIQFFKTKEISISELMEVEHYRPKPKFPLELYHSGFNNNQIELMQKAVDIWKMKTNGKLDVHLILWTPPEKFSEDFYENYKNYSIWLLDGNDPQVVKLFLKYSITMGGLCVGNYIGIIQDNSLTDQQFTKAVAHEIGHLMAMEHIRPEYPALMNLKAKDAITKYDLMQVNYLYPN